MDAKEYWRLFLETGAPELYLMYAQAAKSEGAYVSDHNCAGTADQRLQ